MLNTVCFHEANKEPKSFTQRQNLNQEHLGSYFTTGSRASAPLFSFITRTVSIFLQVQTTCRWYSTPANYRADFKDLLSHSCTSPPFSSSSQTLRRPTLSWCCRLLFSFSFLIADVISFFFPAADIQLSDFAVLMPKFWRRTMNRPAVLFSIIQFVTW